MKNPQNNLNALSAQQTPDILLPEEISDPQSEDLDLAIQEAVRATTPKRRAIKLVKAKPKRPARPPFTIEQILMWSDAHYAATSTWPNGGSGLIPGGGGDTWQKVQAALRDGLRGLPGGTTLAAVLEEHRGVRNPRRLPDLAITTILEWVDHHLAETGDWPHNDSGGILAAPEESWDGINAALSKGKRSLPGGSSVATLLADYRGVRNRARPPHLDIEQILQWADAYKEQHGEWPDGQSGLIEGTLGETWNAVDLALYRGRRGLSGDTTLPRLLIEHRGAPYRRATQDNRPVRALHTPKSGPPNPDFFTIPQILARADAWYLQHGEWPNYNSGPVVEGIEITWQTVDGALRRGSHGLPGGSSLPRLLAEHRGMRDRKALPLLTLECILEWADLHKERTGHWPTKENEAIPDTSDENWSLVDSALRKGIRGLPGGTSLALLLEEHRGVRNPRRLSDLTIATILEWADHHHAETGDWPHHHGGAILAASGETWGGINRALRLGYRALPGKSSLATVLMDYRGVRNRGNLPHLNKEQILLWADAYKERHGKWPNRDSGPIEGTQGETWNGVGVAFSKGTRGLSTDTTLAELLAERRGAPYTPSPQRKVKK